MSFLVSGNNFDRRMSIWGSHKAPSALSSTILSRSKLMTEQLAVISDWGKVFKISQSFGTNLVSWKTPYFKMFGTSSHVTIASAQ